MRRLDRWLFAPGSAERLAALRIGLCSILALRLTRSVYAQLADQPAALFRPRTFMDVFASMPPRAVVLAVQVLGIAAAVLAAYGWRARITLPVAWTAGMFLMGMTTSLGKVVHNDVLLLLTMAPLLVAPVADAWAFDARDGIGREPSSRYGFAWRTALVLVAGAYVFAGTAKLANAGIGWVTSDNLRWVLYASSDAAATPNAAALFVADRPWLFHAVAAFALAVELGFFVVLISRRARPLFAAAAVALHAGIWLTMRLNYWPQAATAVVVLIDWPAVVARVRARAPSSSSPHTAGSGSR